MIKKLVCLLKGHKWKIIDIAYFHLDTVNGGNVPWIFYSFEEFDKMIDNELFIEWRKNALKRVNTVCIAKCLRCNALKHWIRVSIVLWRGNILEKPFYAPLAIGINYKLSREEKEMLEEFGKKIALRWQKHLRGENQNAHPAR